MKNFKFIIVALVALLGFCSCSNQFDSNNEKKLVKYSCMYENNFVFYDLTFEYNEKGQVTLGRYGLYDDETSYNIYSSRYNWGENSIEVSSDIYDSMFGDPSEYTENYTIALENNKFSKLISDSELEEGYYTYDSKGRLKTYKDIFSSDYVCEWDGDKLMSAKNNYSMLKIEKKFTYGNISCVKGYCPIIPATLVNTESLSAAHPEYVGLRTTQCPTSAEFIYEDKSSTLYTYEYEFDEEGYIIKIVETEKNEKGSNTYTTILTWE